MLRSFASHTSVHLRRVDRTEVHRCHSSINKMLISNIYKRGWRKGMRGGQEEN